MNIYVDVKKQYFLSTLYHIIAYFLNQNKLKCCTNFNSGASNMNIDWIKSEQIDKKADGVMMYQASI